MVTKDGIMMALFQHIDVDALTTAKRNGTLLSYFDRIAEEIVRSTGPLEDIPMPPPRPSSIRVVLGEERLAPRETVRAPIIREQAAPMVSRRFEEDTVRISNR